MWILKLKKKKKKKYKIKKKKKKKKKDLYLFNSYVSPYDISCELRIPPNSAVCAISQLRYFRKWKNSSCIINHLTNNIPTMSHYSWTRESRTLDKKLNGKKTSEIKKFYWESNVFKLLKAKKKKKSN